MVEDLGYSLVRIELTGAHRRRLQVMAERTDGSPMSVDDCAELSRAVSALLDVEDVVPGSYTLEVSSPGIDRPLVRLHDFERFAGFEAKVELARPVGGRRRFRGRLLGTDGAAVRVHTQDGDVTFPFADIQSAKLVLTEDLIRAVGGKV
jgi:ribosome maturation factor RimP